MFTLALSVISVIPAISMISVIPMSSMISMVSMISDDLFFSFSDSGDSYDF